MSESLNVQISQSPNLPMSESVNLYVFQFPNCVLPVRSCKNVRYKLKTTYKPQTFGKNSLFYISIFFRKKYFLTENAVHNSQNAKTCENFNIQLTRKIS